MSKINEKSSSKKSPRLRRICICKVTLHGLLHCEKGRLHYIVITRKHRTHVQWVHL